MGRKPKFEADIKLEIVEDILDNKHSIGYAARLINVSTSTIRSWISKYKTFGALGLQTPSTNRVYSEDLKLHAIMSYLNGEASFMGICEKYKINDESILKSWVLQYNSGIDSKHKMSGGSHMKTSRDTTLEERIQIVEDCIANDINYGQMAIKYNVSYQQVRSWTKKYMKMGKTGLEDRRGRRIKDQTPRTPEETMKQRIAELEHQVYMLTIERDLLKKVKELEMRDALDNTKI